MARCTSCGTDGVWNSMNRFVNNDWLRANELKARNDKLEKALIAAQKQRDFLLNKHPELLLQDLSDAIKRCTGQG